MTPAISIVTPVYNGADHLPDTIASVLAQTLSDWEWVIVNDGSTDQTRALLDGLGDQRIVVIHQENGGVSAARNRALDVARGGYVTFLDADDRLPTNALEIRSAYLDDHPEVDIVNGRVRITSNGEEIRSYVPSMQSGPLFPRLARLDEGVFFAPFYMLRRNRIGTRRFPVGVSHCEDIIFFLSLSHDTDLDYGAVNAVVYEYRQHPGSAMSDLAGIERGYSALLQVAAGLKRLAPADLRFLRRRVQSILIKSWLRRGRPLRALAVPAKLARTVSG